MEGATDLGPHRGESDGLYSKHTADQAMCCVRLSLLFALGVLELHGLKSATAIILHENNLTNQKLFSLISTSSFSTSLQQDTGRKASVGFTERASGDFCNCHRQRVNNVQLPQ